MWLLPSLTYLLVKVLPTSSEDAVLDLDVDENETLSPLHDSIDDGLYAPYNYDASCDDDDGNTSSEACDGWRLPNSTIETETIVLRKRKIKHDTDSPTSSCDLSDFTRNVYGGEGLYQISMIDFYLLHPLFSLIWNIDPDEGLSDEEFELKIVDKHWGNDEKVLKLRDALREAGHLGGKRSNSNKTPRRSQHHRFSEDKSAKGNKIYGRPPIFLMPGLASTRLVSWSDKICQHPLVSDIKMQDYIWLNVKVRNKYINELS